MGNYRAKQQSAGLSTTHLALERENAATVAPLLEKGRPLREEWDCETEEQ